MLTINEFSMSNSYCAGLHTARKYIAEKVCHLLFSGNLFKGVILMMTLFNNALVQLEKSLLTLLKLKSDC
jgi:hypothetical protein